MNKGYSICLNEWATDKRIKSELGLLLIISGHTAKTGVCFASNKYLANTFGVDEATISRKIKKIESAGYIEIEYEKRGNEITKRFIRLTKRSSDRIQKDHPTDDEKVMYNSTSNNTTSNNIYMRENKKFKPPSEKDVIDFFIDSSYCPSVGAQAFRYYDSANWTDSSGRPVLNWKQKMMGVWFKPENKNKSTSLFDEL